MKYDVHVYHTVRSKFSNIKAESYEDAIKKTESMSYKDADETEHAEDVTSYVVDLVGDDDLSKSLLFDVDDTGSLVLVGRDWRKET